MSAADPILYSDLEVRRLGPPPAELAAVLAQLVRSDDYAEMTKPGGST